MSLEFPPISTLADLPPHGRFLVGSCAGTSMWPTVKPGERVLIVRVDAASAGDGVAVGDVLAFAAADGRLTIHRLVKLSRPAAGEWVAITRGDNVAYTERWPLAGAIVGKVVARITDGKYNRIADRPRFCRRLRVRIRGFAGRWFRRLLGRGKLP